MKENRPWGYYEILGEYANCKVKSICVFANNRLSYQRHQKRAEHWYIVEGTATVTIDDQTFTLEAGESIDIPIGQKHRIGATQAPVVFIEVQTGIYFGEDDIERLEDDYSR